jgi:hypothetical protein
MSSTEATAVKEVIKTLKHIMGDIIVHSKDSWSAWTGGEPKGDWTGLNPSAPVVETTSPNQLRPVYVSAAQKGYNHRRTGMLTLFKPTDNLVSFQNAVWNHLFDTGMDCIAFVPDPTDNAKMTNVVKSHARYTVQSAQQLIEKQLEVYDKYNKTNNKAARTHLLASLPPLLSNKIVEKLDDSDPFPIVWLQFLKTIQSTSIEQFEDLKSSIKLRENLEQLAAQFRKDALKLTTAGQHDHNLTLVSKMKIFLFRGGSSGNKDFRFQLHATKQKLEQALLDIGFKEKTAANDHKTSELKLTYKDICTQAEDTYRTLFDRKEWPPARHVRDSKAPPSTFGNLAVENNAPITRGELLTWIQNKPHVCRSPTKKPGNCNNCGKSGHWANECPGKQQALDLAHSWTKGIVHATTTLLASLDGAPRHQRQECRPPRKQTPTRFIGAPRARGGQSHTQPKRTLVSLETLMGPLLPVPVPRCSLSKTFPPRSQRLSGFQI